MEQQREKLRNEQNGYTCGGITHRFTIFAKHPEKDDEVLEIKGYIQTGEYPDGSLGEVFVKVGKPGDNLAMVDQWAVSTSNMLQRCDREDAIKLLRSFTNQRFEPAGATSNKKIPRCTSLVDYIARWLLRRYYPEAGL